MGGSGADTVGTERRRFGSNEFELGGLEEFEVVGESEVEAEVSSSSFRSIRVSPLLAPAPDWTFPVPISTTPFETAVKDSSSPSTFSSDKSSLEIFLESVTPPTLVPQSLNALFGSFGSNSET